MVNLLKTLSIISIVFFASCSKNNGFTIEGTISGAENKVVYLEKIAGQSTVVDSFTIGSNGKFKFVGSSEKPGVFRLNFSNIRALDLILDNTSNVELTIDATKRMDEYELKGSDVSLKIKDINKILYDTYKVVEGLQNEYAAIQDKPDAKERVEKLEKQYEETMNNQVAQIKAYTEKNNEAIIDIYAVSYLNIDDNYEFIKSVIEKHKSELANSDYTQQYSEKFNDYSKVAIGSVAPEINLPDPNGKEISLSSLKGKVVLLDFWASWCGPCRHENPNNVKLYNQYKAKGFEIYGVSLDKSMEAWKKAIVEDNLTWLHVSDLRYWDSKAAALYKVEAIPATFLLDKDGKIIAKNLRGDELAEFLKKLFN